MENKEKAREGVKLSDYYTCEQCEAYEKNNGHFCNEYYANMKNTEACYEFSANKCMSCGKNTVTHPNLTCHKCYEVL